MLYLLRHRDRVVPKDELLEELWPGSVSESVLPRCITAARRALADDSARQDIIETIRRRGYRFVASVVSRGTTPTPAPAAGPVPTQAGGVPPSQPTAPPSSGPPFVGRQAPMAQLHAALDAAMAGHGRLVLLMGEPGIGKTRTAQTLVSAARTAGATVLTARCSEGDGAPAFWPWVQLLRRALDQDVVQPAHMQRHAADLSVLIPEIRDRVAIDDDAPAVTPEQARFRQFDAVMSVLRAAAATRPIVVLVDDLHWADAPSLLLLRFVAEAMGDARLLIVGTCRDLSLPRTAPLSQLLGALAREPTAQRIALEGLTSHDIVGLLTEVTDIDAAERWADHIHTRTEGNPFFVVELLAMLSDGERLQQPPDADTVGLPLPIGISEALGRRMSGVSDRCHQALTVASLIGREIPMPVLSLSLGVPIERLLDVMHEGVRRGLLVEHGGSGGHYAFSHALIRETLIDDLPTPDRVRMHLRIAQAMEAVYGHQPGPHLAELSDHFFRGAAAGDPAKAIEYAVAAARRAWSSLAFEEAARHYARALEAMRLSAPVDEGHRARLLLRLGEAHLRSGDTKAGRRVYRTAAEVAEGLGDARLLARAALGMAQHTEFGLPKDPELIECLRRAERALGDTDLRLRAHLLAKMAVCAPYSESLEQRRSLSRRAVDLATSIDDPQALGYALLARFWALAGPDDHTERLELSERLATLADDIDDGNLAFFAQEMKTITLSALGQMPAARRTLAEVERLAGELGHGVMQWYVEGLWAGAALCEGRFDEAAVRIERYVKSGHAMHPGASLLAGAQRLWLFRGHDRLEEYLVIVQGMAGRFSWGHRIRTAAEAFVHAARGRLEPARAALDVLAADDGLNTLARDEHWMSLMVQLAFVAHAVGDAERAEVLRTLLLPYAHRPAFHERTRVHAGVCARFVALLCVTTGRHDEAAQHFEDAIAMNEKIGARPYEARSRYDYAVFLLREPSAPAHRLRAHALAGDAARIARALGMPDLIPLADALAAQTTP